MVRTFSRLVKLPAHRAGLPGNVITFLLCPFTPPIPLGRDGAHSGQETMKMYGLRSNICAKMKKIPQLDLLKNINEIKGLIRFFFIVLKILIEVLIKN